MRYELAISGVLHVAVLAAAVFMMPAGEPLSVEEALPVDLMTTQEFSQIAKGEKTAKPQDTPQLQADKKDAPKPQRESSPQPIARHDAAAPPPGSSPMPQPKPPDIDRAAEEAKAQAVKEKAADQARKEAAAKRAAEEKAAQAEAMQQLINDNLAAQQRQMEALAQQQAEQKAAKEAADKRAAEQKAAEEKRIAKTKAAARKAEQAKYEKLLQQALNEAGEAKPTRQTAAQAAPQPRSYDQASIEDLLNKDPPARSARGGEEVANTPSLGRMEASAPKLLPSEQDRLARQIHDHIYACWDKPVSQEGSPSSPAEVQFELNRDGTLASEPRVVRYTNTPLGTAVANNGLRAIKRCLTQRPLELPPELYRYWANGEIGFDLYQH